MDLLLKEYIDKHVNGEISESSQSNDLVVKSDSNSKFDTQCDRSKFKKKNFDRYKSWSKLRTPKNVKCHYCHKKLILGDIINS